MNPTALATLWSHVFTHLWQSTVVLIVLWGCATLIRGASHRLQHAAWGLALLKFLLPFPLFQELGRRLGMLAPFGSDTLVQGFGVVVEPVWISRLEGAKTTSVSGEFAIVLTVLWSIGCAYILVRTVTDWRRSRSLQQSAERLPTRDASGLETGTSCIWLTDEPVLPSALGIRQGIILLPRRILAELSPVELRSVLLHEQAHIDRRDLVWTLVQRLAFALFFFFPPLWLVLSQLHRKAELACDEAALRAGVSPQVLARALARTLRLGLDNAGLAPTFATKSPSVLTERLHRLSQPRRYVSMRRHRIVFTLALIGVGVLTLCSFVPSSGGPIDAFAEGTEVARDSEKLESNVVPPKPIAESVVYPEFPDEARKLLDESGRVLLQATISPDGLVTKITEVSGIDGCPQCTENATVALRQWRFEPAKSDGEPMAFQVVVPFQYALENGAADTSTKDRKSTEEK